MAKNPLAKKSSKTLAKRMEALRARGFNWPRSSMTMAQIAEVVGDLTWDEFDRMLVDEQSRVMIAETIALGRARAAAAQRAGGE
jgi:hypothetical protein